MRHEPVHATFCFLVNRVENQKQTQTATKWWPFGFIFGVQLGSLERKKRGLELGPVRAALVDIYEKKYKCHICVLLVIEIVHGHVPRSHPVHKEQYTSAFYLINQFRQF